MDGPSIEASMKIFVPMFCILFKATVLTAAFYFGMTAVAEKPLGPRTPLASEAGFTTASITSSVERAGDLVPSGTNFTLEANRAMGLAMEAWNAHRWVEGVAGMKAIYENVPDSPWAAEAELHVAYFHKYNAEYDEAEARFLAVLNKHDVPRIQKKALLYLPHLYALTGRIRAAQDTLDLLNGFDLSWQESQFYENWSRRLHLWALKNAQNKNCGSKVAVLARISRDNPARWRNRSLADVYSSFECDVQESYNPAGYSIFEIAAMIDGTARRLSFDELKQLVVERRDVIAYLRPPAPPLVYETLDWPINKREAPEPSGHFVLLEKVADHFVDIVDPDGGMARWTADHFQYRWKGEVIAGDMDVGRNLADHEWEMRGSCCCDPPPDPCTTECCMAGGGGLGGPGGGPFGGSGGPVTECTTSQGQTSCGFGSPVYQFGLASANLALIDTPMWYPPIGILDMKIKLMHNRVNTQNMVTNTAANYYSFGNKWSFNYNCFIKETPAGIARITLENGDLHEFYPVGGGVYTAADYRVSHTFSKTDTYARLTLDGGHLSYLFPSNVVDEGDFLIRMEDNHGNHIRFDYDELYRLTNVIDSAGRYFRLSGNELGLVTNISDILGRSAIFDYDEHRNLISMTDMGGYTTHLQYDGVNWVTNMIYPNGSSIRFDYYYGYQLYNVSNFQYSVLSNQLLKMVAVNSLGVSSEYYNHAHTHVGPITVEVGSENRWAYAHDDQEPSQYIYSDTVNAAYTNNSVWGDFYNYRKRDLKGNLIEEITAIQASPVIVLWLETIDPAWRRTVSNLYDGFDRIVSETLITNVSVVAVWSNAYDYAGDLIARYDPYGQPTRYGYDDDSNLMAITNALGHAARMLYDTYGNVTNYIDARSNTTAMIYLTNGLLSKVVLPNHTTNSSTYDLIGRVSTVTDTAGLTTSNVYEDLDRITSIRYPDGTSMEYQYVCCGLESIVDRLGIATHYEYDILGRMTRLNNGLGHTTDFRYDASGNITNLIVYSGGQTNTTAFRFTATNGFSRMTQRTSPLGKTTSYGYTFRGQVVARTNGMNQVTRFTYDALDRLRVITYPTNSPLVRMEYDKLSRLTSITNTLSRYTYTYDALGQITNATTTLLAPVPGWSNISYRIDSTYDPSGNRSSLKLVGFTGFTNIIHADFQYDSVNALSSVSNQFTSATYHYDAAGRLSWKVYGNGDETHYGYDLESRLHSLSVSNGANTIASWWYGYNAMGMITAITSLSETIHYEYDSIYQLRRQIEESNKITHWQYDEAGNILGVTAPSNTTHYQYNADNELAGLGTTSTRYTNVEGWVEPGPASNKWYDTWAASGGKASRIDPDNGMFTITNVAVTMTGTSQIHVVVTDVSGNQATQSVAVVHQPSLVTGLASYDLNGNLINLVQDGITNRYFYDGEDRLVRVTMNGATNFMCWYDGFGRRIAKQEIISGQTNRCYYAYDGWSVVAVLNEKGQILEHYTRGLGLVSDIGTIIAETRFTNGSPIATYTYHHNHRGDVTTIRNGATTIATLDYEAFGAIRTKTGSYSPRFAFSSKELDQSNGLYYFGYRMYSTIMGRFVTTDPLGEKGGPNLYLFTDNNPLVSVDTDGLIAMRIGGGRAIGIALDILCTLSEGFKAKRENEKNETWRYAHCMASCNIKQKCGLGWAIGSGIGKEYWDLGRCLLGNDDSCHSAFQPSDFKDNLTGLVCPKDKDCASQCKDLKEMRDTRGGPFSWLRHIN